MSDYNLGTARGTIEIGYKDKGVKNAQRDMEGLGKSGTTTSAALGKVTRVAGGVGLIIAGGLAVAANAAANFEQRLSGIEAVSGATAKEMDSLRDKALQLGKDTQFSAGESAQAIEELIKAGLSVKDVLNGAADATVNLAAAGEIDMPAAAAIASNAMNQFGLAAKNLPKVADSIAGAANASAIDVGEFGQSLAQVGAVANLAGLDFHDTAVAIAEMGNAGIKGSDAGTSLKSMLMRLQPTTKKAADTFQELGIMQLDAAKAAAFLAENGVKPAGSSFESMVPQLRALNAQISDVPPGSAAAEKSFDKFLTSTTLMSNAFYDANGNLKSLSDIQEILKTSMAGYTAEQKQATLQTLFGSDAIRAAAILSDEGAAGYDKMSTSMGKVTAAEVAATKMDNLKGSLEQLKGSAETLGIALGTILLPAIRDIVDGATNLLNKFLSLSDGQQQMVVTGALMVAGFLLTTVALIKLVQFAQAARAAYVALRLAIISTSVAASAQAGFAALAAGVTGSTTGATLMTRVLNILGKGLRVAAIAVKAFTVALLTNPIFLIIAAIIALVAIFVLLYKKNETVRNAIDAAWAGIKAAIGAVVDWLVGTAWPLIQSVWDGIVSGVGSIVGGVKSAWDSMMSVISVVVSAIALIIGTYVAIWKAVILGAVRAIKAVWDAVWGTFGGVITAVFNLIVAIIQLGIAIIKLIIGVALLAIMTVWNLFWNSLKVVVSAVWGFIVGVVTFYVNLLKTIITTVFNAIRAVVVAIWNTLAGITRTAWNAVKSALSGPVNALKGIVSSALGAVRGAVTSAWNVVKSATSSAWNALKGIVSGAIDKVVALAKGIKNKVLSPFSGAASWLLNAGKNIIRGLLSGIESMINGVTSKLKKLTSLIPKVKGPESRDKKLLEPAGRWIMEGLGDSLDDGAKRVLRNLSNMNTRIPATIDATMSGAVDAAINVPTIDLSSAASLRLQDAYKNSNKDKGALRMVSGVMKTDKGFDVYVKGRAQEVNESNRSFEDIMDRMGA